MKTSFKNDERGIAHILEIVIIGAVVLGVIGFIGWRVMTSQNASDLPLNSNVVPCESDDKDLCRFLTNWKQTADFKVTSTQTAEGKTTTNVFESSENGKKTHAKLELGGSTTEVIMLESTLYTRGTDGTWWKQTLPEDKLKEQKSANSYDFKEPEKDAEPAKKTEYLRLDNEKCGNLDCFKYRIIDPENSGETQYIWFDTKDYQLRQMRVEAADGSVSEQVFSYEKVNISEPSPVKELGPNQYIVPGSSEPTTLPNPADYTIPNL